MAISSQGSIHNLLCNWVNIVPIVSLKKTDLLSEEGENIVPSKWLIIELEKLFNNEDVKVVAKVLSAYGNAIIKIEIVQNKVEREDLEVEPEVQHYCLVLESLGLYTDYAGRHELENAVSADDNLSPYMPAPYASKEFQSESETEHVVLKLMPFYANGTLMSLSSIGSYLSDAPEQKKLLEIYKKTYLTDSVYNPFCGLLTYFPNPAIDKLDVAQFTRKDIVTFQTFEVALHKLSGFIKPDEAKSALTHIQLYFTKLCDSLEKIGVKLPEELLNNIQKNTQCKKEDENYYCDKLAPIVDLFKEIHEIIKNFISDEERKLLNEVIDQQQQAVWKWVGEVLLLFNLLQKAGIQYYDLKPENLLINKNNQLGITDKKACVRYREKKSQATGNSKVFRPATHLTYYPPEFNRLVMLGRDWKETEAQGVTLYQLGAMFYNMLIGLPREDLGEGAHEFYETLIKAAITSKFDFHLQNFQTPIGKALQEIIVSLTNQEPSERVCLEVIRARYDQHNKALQVLANHPVMISERKKNDKFEILLQKKDNGVFSAPKTAVEAEKNKGQSRQHKTQKSSCLPSVPTCNFFKKPNNVTVTQTLLLGAAATSLIVGGVVTGLIIPSIAATFILSLAGGVGVGASRVYMSRNSP